MLLQQPHEIQAPSVLRGMIYGQPGVGKTTLALSFPKAVLIDTDRGVHRVSPLYRVPTLSVGAYKDILDLLKSNELAGFETIVIDTVGKLIDYIIEYVKRSRDMATTYSGDLSQKGWGFVSIEFKNLFARIEALQKNVILVAHEAEEKLTDGRVIKRPSIAGGTRKTLPEMMEFIGYMSSTNNGDGRVLNLNPSEDFYAKNGLGIDSVFNVANPERVNNFASVNIVDAYKKVVASGTEKANEFKLQMSVFDEKLEEVSDADSANDILKSINNYEDFFGFHQIVKQKLWLKAKDLDLDFKNNCFAIKEKQEEHA